MVSWSYRIMLVAQFQKKVLEKNISSYLFSLLRNHENWLYISSSQKSEKQ